MVIRPNGYAVWVWTRCVMPLRRASPPVPWGAGRRLRRRGPGRQRAHRTLPAARDGSLAQTDDDAGVVAYVARAY
jgi:hypothetical protein